MENQSIDRMFANRIMFLMEKAYDIILNFDYKDENTNKIKFDILKDLSSLTAEVLKKEDINISMKKIAESSKVNGDNIDDKIKTFRMIRNVINHFPLFDTWDEIYISADLLEWNGSCDNQIKNYFKVEREFSYTIFLKEDGEWVPRKEIHIKTPKLGKYNKIYLKDILSLDDALWTFGIIDYYLQLLGLQIKTRIMISA